MKKIINILIIKLLIVTNLFANDNNGSIQVFVSKTNGLTKIGKTEELLVGSLGELTEVLYKIIDNEKKRVDLNLNNDIKNSTIESKNEIMSTDNAIKAGAVGAVATAGAVSAAAVNSGKSISDGMKGGGLIGLAAIGATVGAVAIYNETQGMRNDYMYVGLYRNTVGNETGLLYVTVISNSELKREEVRTEIEKRIK